MFGFDTGFETLSGVPIIINCRDRLAPLVGLVDYLERAGQERIYLVDNDSAYPPLIEYLAHSPHQVVRLGRNAGRLSPWESNLFDELGISGRFVFTDPDIVPDENCPLDAIDYFGEILDTYPEQEKAGFGLRIDDIPDTYKFKHEVVIWESQFWERRLAPRVYDAPIDTTFALYNRPAPHRFDRAVRTGFPYVARHTPWYLDDRSLPEDEAFYRNRSEGEDVNYWGREALPPAFAAGIAAREAQSRTGTEMNLGDAGALTDSALLAASGWGAEPELQDETAYTAWADPGWHSWNDMSPELELCDALVSLVAAFRPTRIIETGTGQGFLTRRIAAVLRDDQTLTCFESDPTWRQALTTVPFFDGQRCIISPEESPDAVAFASADLACLDADFPYRLLEIEQWWRVAAEGAVLFVHDTGNGHGPDTPHATLRAKIMELSIPGFFLANPRGAFIGVKPMRSADPVSVEALRARLQAAEDELHALQATKRVPVLQPGAPHLPGPEEQTTPLASRVASPQFIGKNAPSRLRAVTGGGEAGQTTEDVQRRVDELGWWYHHFELPSGVWTGTGEPPAYDPIERWNLFEPHLPDDLEGKSVLDVGGNSGYFSLRMKQRGAGRCLMVEPVVEFVDQANFVFEQFGVEVDVVCEDVHAWCLTTDERFDYVLFLGLFYHLKYPVLVLDRLAEMTKELMVFNSHIEGIPPEAPPEDGAAPSGVGRLRRSLARRLDPSRPVEARPGEDLDRDELQSPLFPRMSFLEGAYRGDLSNWWVPNYEALEPLVRSAGLRVLGRPHPEMVVAEPERYFGTARYGELVFPRYGKAEGGPVFPGEQRVAMEEVLQAADYQARLRATR